MTTAQTEDVLYRGYRLTVTSRDVIVQARHGRTRARFKSMATAGAFIRQLNRLERTP